MPRKGNIVCVDCKLARRQAHTWSATCYKDCPNCGQRMVWIGTQYEVPRKINKTGWKRLSIFVDKIKAGEAKYVD